MPFPNQSTQFKPGQSGNPKGHPKGKRNLSTWIQKMLNEEELDGEPPVKAIVKVAIENAKLGKDKDREWLAKYGYGTKIAVEHSGEVRGEHDPTKANEYAKYLEDSTKPSK
jgi:hypothetical protein